MMKKLICLLILMIVSIVVYAETAVNLSEDEANAATLYRKASSMLTELPQDFPTMVKDIITKGWEEDNKELKEILIKNQEAIKEFRKASELLNCDFSFGKPIKKELSTKLPTYIKEINLARLVIIEGRLYEKENKWDLALNNYLSVLRFANHFGQQRDFILISKIISIIVEKLPYLPLEQYIINRKDLSAQNCQILLDNLIFLKDNRTDLEIAFLEEKDFLKNTIRTLGDEAKQEGRYNDIFYQKFYEESDKLFEEFFGYLITAFKENKTEVYEEKINKFNADVETETKPLNLAWDAIKNMMGLPDGVESPTLVAKIMVSLAMPQFSKVIKRYYVSLSEFNILIAAAAVKLYELKNGKIPDSLQELIPNYLSKIPEDPFNDFKPLQFKKKDKGWIIFSFGPDKENNYANFKYDENKDLSESISGADNSGDIVFSSF